MRHANFVRLIVGLAALSAASPSFAQLVIQDDFNSASSTFPWTAFDGACLTAGDGTGTIPACVGLSYYKSQTQVGGTGGTLPDATGSGALRLTNGTTPVNGNFLAHQGNFQYGYNQAGGIISNFTFPSNEGLLVTFTAISYRGDSQDGDGADGISFFLMDGSYPPYDTGAFGGSLGYDCSNSNNDPTQRADGTVRGYDGLAGAYLGLGIDEYGNFGNQHDNSATGPNVNAKTPSEIGLRGAGNVTWAQLLKNHPTYFPSLPSASQQQSWVHAVCSTGKLIDYSGGTTVQPTLTIPDYTAFNSTFFTLPAGKLIATEAALTRGAATPIAYKLQITAAGLLSFAYSYNGGAYQPVMTGQNLTALNGAAPANFRFGFAGSTGGSTNVHELMCFQASPSTVSASSAGLNQQQTAKVQTGSQVYFAYYNPNTWVGSLTSNSLVVDPLTNAVSIATTANWDASCVLTGVATGGTCATTGVAGFTAAQAPAARTMLTYSGTIGIPFEYAPSLPAAMATALTAGDASPNATRLNFLRGDRTYEQNSAGTGVYRERYGVLGDIMDSSPAWVGPPSAPYTAAFTDLLSTGTAGVETSYLAFKGSLAAATRLNVVYVGANDGFVHGFRTGAYTTAGAYVANSTYPNDGQEVLAYMPQAVEEEIHTNTAVAPATANIDFANPLYGHAFYVDASPASGDLYYKGAWHTFLVGGLGAGGNAIYALDVTDPTTFSETAAAAQATVITELSTATIACANVAACTQYLGNTNGTPSIRRFHNGQWGFIFGNGYGSTAGTAGIFVALFDASGTMTTYYYAASGATGNGIAYATPVDLDGDHITDYVYAGDLLGNVWKFDLTSNNPTNWVVRAAPVFTTASGQPITTRLIAASVPASIGLPRLMLAFGTGLMTPLTNSSPATYATASQSLYGVWDSDMAAWNGKGSVSYATLAPVMTLTPLNLELQSVTSTVAAPAGGVGVAYRTVSSAPICWAGTSACAGAAAQFGWAMTLPTTDEQVIYSPILQYGAFIVNTTIPANNSPTNCEPTTATGWTMALSMANGGAFTSSFFVNSNHQFVSNNGQPVNGVELNGTGSPSIVTTPASSVAGGPPPGTDLVTQTVSGTGAVIAVNATVAVTGTRVTWAQIR